MFDFVQPRFAGWRVRGFGGQAGGDEAGTYAIHTLLIAYKRRSAADPLGARLGGPIHIAGQQILLVSYCRFVFWVLSPAV